MNLPFTVDQFYAVFAQYNHAVWPAQLVLLAMALVAAALVVWPRAYSGIAVSAILSVLWAWLGVAYHLVFFSRINRLAFVFAAISILGSFAFLWWGVVRRRVRFERRPRWRAWSGGYYCPTVYSSTRHFRGSWDMPILPLRRSGFRARRPFSRSACWHLRRRPYRARCSSFPCCGRWSAGRLHYCSEYRKILGSGWRVLWASSSY
jgi:Family of unknown function (DUF6064)